VIGPPPIECDLSHHTVNLEAAPDGEGHRLPSGWTSLSVITNTGNDAVPVVPYVKHLCPSCTSRLEAFLAGTAAFNRTPPQRRPPDPEGEHVPPVVFDPPMHERP